MFGAVAPTEFGDDAEQRKRAGVEVVEFGGQAFDLRSAVSRRRAWRRRRRRLVGRMGEGQLFGSRRPSPV